MRQNLVVLMQAYAQAKGWSDATVSRKLHGDHRFLATYRAGERSLGVDTYYLIANKIVGDWPDGVKWPALADIPKIGEKVAARKK